MNIIKSDEIKIMDNIIERIKLHPYVFSSNNLKEIKILRKNIRSKVEWEEKEIQVLLKGVNEYGMSNWTKIFNEYKNIFNSNRRIIDLVDKYNQISKKTTYYTTEKRSWIEINKDFIDKTDEMGQCIITITKFPFDAAKNIIKRQKKNKIYLEGEIIIRNYNNKDDIHMYKYNSINGKLMIKKLAFIKNINMN